MGKRHRTPSESGGSTASPKQKKSKTLANALYDNLSNGYDDAEEQEVWLVRKPISVTCEDLEEASLRFPTTSSKPSTSAKIPSDRRVICQWDKPRCSLIRLPLAGKKSQLRGGSELEGSLHLTMKHKDADHQANADDGGVIEFPPVRKLPQVPPKNVRLFQRLKPFGVSDEPPKKKTKKRKKEKY